jgi:hypothetical protein
MDQGTTRKWMANLKNIAFFLWLFFIVDIWLQQSPPLRRTMVMTKMMILDLYGLIKSECPPLT